MAVFGLSCMWTTRNPFFVNLPDRHLADVLAIEHGISATERADANAAAQRCASISSNRVCRHNGQEASQQRLSHVGSFPMAHRTSSISITRPAMLPCVRRI